MLVLLDLVGSDSSEDLAHELSAGAFATPLPTGRSRFFNWCNPCGQTVDNPCRVRSIRNLVPHWPTEHPQEPESLESPLETAILAGDDPVNESDPTGLGAGGIDPACTGGGPIGATPAQDRQLCAAGQQARQAEQASLGPPPCTPPLNFSLWNTIGNWISSNRTPLIAGVGLLAGTAALLIPGAEPLGGELDAESIAALTGSEAEGLSAAQLAKGLTGFTAVAVDALACRSHPNLESCGAAALGGFALFQPGDVLDPVVAWILSVARYASAGGQ